MYYHFPSKEAIAEHLISDWNHFLDEIISEALAAGSSSADTLGAAHAAAALCEDLNITTRIEDVVAAHLRGALG